MSKVYFSCLIFTLIWEEKCRNWRKKISRDTTSVYGPLRRKIYYSTGSLFCWLSRHIRTEWLHHSRVWIFFLIWVYVCYLQTTCYQGGSSCSIRTHLLDCDIVVSEFKLQSRYCIHFRTNAPWEKYEPTYPPSYELNSTTTILPQTTKVEMLLYKQIKPNQTRYIHWNLQAHIHVRTFSPPSKY